MLSELHKQQYQGLQPLALVKYNDSENRRTKLNKEQVREIRRKYNADRVFITQFHNGGTFYTNSPMQKASITYERCSDGLQRIADKFQNYLVSNLTWYATKTLKAL
jgi:hypothetical protein